MRYKPDKVTLPSKHLKGFLCCLEQKLRPLHLFLANGLDLPHSPEVTVICASLSSCAAGTAYLGLLSTSAPCPVHLPPPSAQLPSPLPSLLQGCLVSHVSAVTAHKHEDPQARVLPLLDFISLNLYLPRFTLRQHTGRHPLYSILYTLYSILYTLYTPHRCHREVL